MVGGGLTRSMDSSRWMASPIFASAINVNGGCYASCRQSQAGRMQSDFPKAEAASTGFRSQDNFALFELPCGREG